MTFAGTLHKELDTSERLVVDTASCQRSLVEHSLSLLIFVILEKLHIIILFWDLEGYTFRCASHKGTLCPLR